MTYIENPKTKGSGIICAIPQTGIGGGKGITLDVIDGELEGLEPISPLDILVGLVAPAVDSGQNVP